MRGPYALAPVYSSPTVLHEYVHHFMLHYAPATYPGWYREGFAEFFSTVIFDEEGHAQLGHFPDGRADDLLYSRRYRIADMLSEDPDTHPIAIYAQGWLMVHHSIFHTETREMLSAYLSRINRGSSAEQAHLATFATINNFEDMMNDYGRRDMPTSTTTRTFDVASEIATTTLSEEASEIAMLYPRRLAYFERELQSAARRYRQNPQALAELAQLRLAENRLTDAIDAADAALAIDPNHKEANAFKGTALLRQALAGGRRNDPRWTESRALFLRANRSDPYYPLALLRYYQSFPDSEDRPENAPAALEQAFLFVPQNPAVRLQLSLAFLRAGRFEEAALLVEPLSRSLHSTDTLSAAARTIIERARRGSRDTEIEGVELRSFLEEG